jgi:uroporphyrinogen-III synthase
MATTPTWPAPEAGATGATGATRATLALITNTSPLLVVTRPAAQAVAWVQALQSLGCPAQALPLIDILPAPEPLAVQQAWQQLAAFHGVMFVSSNAVDGFFAHRPAGLEWPTGVWAGSTGPGTSAALCAQGLHNTQIVQPAADSAQFDSEALWLQLQARSSAWQGQQVLVVRGGLGRDWLADTLRDAGTVVQFVVAYQRRPPQPDAAGLALLANACARPAHHIWLFSSSQAVLHLLQLAPQAHWAQSQAWVTHPRIGQAARAAGFGSVLQIGPGIAAAAQQLHGRGRHLRAEGDPYNPQPCE